MRRRICIIIFAVFALVNMSVAAPHHGDRVMFDQPDGSKVPVILWGDEYHIDAESPDGHTLVRGDDGWICYAELSADGSEYVSTGVRYTGSSRALTRKGIRISAESAREKRRRNREILGYEEAIAPTEFSESLKRPRPSRKLGKARSGGEDFSHAPAAEPKRVVGLTLLIQFPDQPASEITRESVEEFCNRVGGLGGTSSAGSVRDYFLDVSNGAMEYVNIVTPFVTVDSARSYYDDGQTGYRRVSALITSALRKLDQTGFDMSEVTTEAGMGWGSSAGRQTVVALNIFYAGSAPARWATGIWPHMGTYTGGATVGGLSFSRYQMSNLGTRSNPPGIGTFVHENGHLIMRWPDLYPYSDAQVVPPTYVGSYCVMASSNGTNPQPPNPHFRNMAGWIDVTDITEADGAFTHVSNSHSAYQFRRNDRESYFIEARRRTGRSANLPGEGLIIWHVHTNGNNTNHNTVKYPLVTVVKADNGSGAPGANAPFRAGGGSRKTEFNSSTAPAAVYHDGVLSNLRVSEVTASGTEMGFKIGGGDGGPRTYYLSVVDGTGGGYYEAGAMVGLTAASVNDAGRYFFRWTGSAVQPDNAYSRETFVTMGTAEASVTANYARGHALPGQAEADTAAFMAGFAGYSNTAATGGRTARVRSADTAQYALYVVDIAEGGDYELTYRILARSSNKGTLYLMDAASGEAFDTVAVPVGTSSTGTMQTVVGKTVGLKKGTAVWRLEAAPGTEVQVDWFAIGEPGGFTPTVKTKSADALAYDLKASRSGVTFRVPAAGRVSVKMYDVRGREVAALSSGMKTPGVYNVSMAGRGLGQGMYIVRMTADGYAKNIRFNYKK